MVISRNYFGRVLSLKHGKQVLLGQFLLLLVVMFVFMKTVPWLMAYDISEISRYDKPSPSPPTWARSFTVNHGDFIYYADSRVSNPVRMWSYLGLNIIGMTLSMVFTLWVWRKTKD